MKETFFCFKNVNFWDAINTFLFEISFQFKTVFTTMDGSFQNLPIELNICAAGREKTLFPEQAWSRV